MIPRAGLRVGLTGGIASGKSTVASMFAELGAITIDADKVVAHLYQPGNAGHRALVATYGDAIVREDGQIDRARLSAIAFSSADEAKKLNALIHPIVLAEEERMTAELTASREHAIVIVEATLLLEAGGKARYDRIIVVDVPPELQLARAVGRGMIEDEAARRMAHQMARDERLAAADFVIVNSGDREETRRAVGEVYAKLREELVQRALPRAAPEQS
ncbi:MAG TPA: dephospho-CoA kinase [Thermoanaerobaculia bacterium]